MTLNDLTSKIYVINLKERIDRKKQIEQELKKINCSDYKIIDAVDGESIRNPTNMKKGSYGLIMTYKKIYEDFKISPEENILIIEDDCCFVDSFQEKMEFYIKNVPDDWNILYFGANHNYHIGCTTEKINEECIKLNNSYSSHCVLLKKNVLEELIHLIDTEPKEVDVLLSKLQKKYSSYSSNSPLTTQRPGYSNIENKQMDYRWLIK